MMGGLTHGLEFNTFDLASEPWAGEVVILGAGAMATPPPLHA